MRSRIRVLVVDDSAFMRKALTSMIQSDPQLEVISTARDGEEAIEKVLNLKPDFVTMDIDMPRLNGLEALKIIMAKAPVPVLMVSSLTEEGAQVTLDALESGAVDFIPKNLGNVALNIVRVKEELTSKIKSIVRQRVRLETSMGSKSSSVAARPGTHLLSDSRSTSSHRVRAIAIGTSTGGPKTLHEILPSLPAHLPAGILVVQHMPAVFTEPFARRLNQISRIEVKEAEEGDVVRPGLVLIAPGAFHMKVVKRKPTEVTVELSEEPRDAPHIPSIDVTMSSVAEVYGERSLGIILTGMGHDGREGMKDIKKRNGRTIAQSEESCVVFGMPKSAIEAGVVDTVMSPSQITGEIINMA
ncbi:MAG: chemotaxis response regulator protein-glutamate methylesterase [Pseudomonadota bacterium]